MKGISNETKVGVLAAVAITMLIMGYNFLKGENVFTSTNRFFAEYTKLDGLIESNPVLIKGYKVGHVSDISMDRSTLIMTVWIKIPDDIKVPANSTMKIVNNDMLGSKAIELILGDTASLAKDEDQLNADQDQGIAQAVSEVINPLTSSLGKTLVTIDSAVSKADLETTLKDASLALKSFKETADKLNRLLDGKDAEIDAILKNVQQTTKDLKGLSPKIDAILSDIDQTSKELSEVEFKALANQIRDLTGELKKTTTSINNSDGSLGLMVNDKTLYQDLDATILKLNQLITDIEKYPKRYFGFTSRQVKKAEEQKAEDQGN